MTEAAGNLSLSKETPMDKHYLIYQKAIQNTYLLGRRQSGFMHEMEKISASSPVANEMLLYALKQLETAKLYYLFRSYLNTEDSDENFLLPESCLESTFSLFALSASYAEDVIDGKHEFENLEAVYPDAKDQEPMRTVLNLLTRATQLLPLTRDEITRSGGYLLRTKIRAAIEFLDQLYQYKQAGKTTIDELGKEIFTEDVPSLEEFAEQ